MTNQTTSRSIIELNKIIKKEKPDLIFGNTIRSDIVGSFSAVLTKTKIIWFIQDYTFFKILFKILYFIPKKIFYVSESVRNYYNVNNKDKHKVLYIWRSFYKKIDNIIENEIYEKDKQLDIGAGSF